MFKKEKIIITLVFILSIFISGISLFPSVANAYSSLPNGWYRIRPMHDLRRSIDALGVQVSYQGTRGNNLHMWDSLDVRQQKFYLQNEGGGYFTLRSGYGNGYITVHNKGNGANLYVMKWPYITDSNRFYLVSAGNNSYHIMTKLGLNLNFDCAGGGRYNGNNVQLWTRENSPWHCWRFTRVRY